jgi:glycosyltransferase involved in cell wall biosynthesis
LQFRHFDSWRKSFYEGYPDASEKTRVSSFIGTLGPGGAERQLTNTLIGLATDSRLELGLYCQSLSVASHRFFLPDIRVAGINVFDLTRLTHTAEESGIAAVWPIGLEGSIQFAAALRQERPHIAHFWLDECNIKGGLAALAEGIPKIILSLRSLPPINFSLHRPYMREGYRYLARQKSVILVSNSYAGAGAYEKWLGLERGRVKVIHNGLNFNVAALFSIKASRNRIRSELGLDSAIPVVGLVSRLSEEKRPLLWLEIAACVRQQLPDVKFLIAGDGVQMQLVRERATKADLCGSVVLLPHRSDPLAIMAAMDVFLLTSRLEGLPNVLIEAQALGIPVIAPKVGGIPETFEDGVTGRLFECSDPHDVARLTIEVLRDTDWRSLVATKGPSITQKKFAIDRMIRETRNLYEFK